MRPVSFYPEPLAVLLRRRTVASMPELMAALGTRVPPDRPAQAQVSGLHHQLFPSPQLLRPARVSRFRRRRPLVLRPGPLLPARHTADDRRGARERVRRRPVRRRTRRPAGRGRQGPSAQARARRPPGPRNARRPLPVLRQRSRPARPPAASPPPARRRGSAVAGGRRAGSRRLGPDTVRQLAR